MCNECPLIMETLLRWILRPKYCMIVNKITITKSTVKFAKRDGTFHKHLVTLCNQIKPGIHTVAKNVDRKNHV